MSKVRFFVVFSVVVFLISACGAGGGELQVNNGWARPGLAGGNGGAFFVINNPVGADMLLSASSDVADTVEMHKTVMQDGNMQMVQQMNVPVPIGETAFEPGDLHVMLIGLKNDLNPGDTFTLRLKFENAGEKELTVTVREP